MPTQAPTPNPLADNDNEGDGDAASWSSNPLASPSNGAAASTGLTLHDGSGLDAMLGARVMLADVGARAPRPGRASVPARLADADDVATRRSARVSKRLTAILRAKRKTRTPTTLAPGVFAEDALAAAEDRRRDGKAGEKRLPQYRRASLAALLSTQQSEHSKGVQKRSSVAAADVAGHDNRDDDDARSESSATSSDIGQDVHIYSMYDCFRAMAPLLRPYYGWIALLCFSSLLIAFIGTTMPQLTARLYDDASSYYFEFCANPNPNHVPDPLRQKELAAVVMTDLRRYALAVLANIVVVGLDGLVDTYVTTKVEYAVTRQVSMRMLQKHAHFFQAHPAGELTKRALMEPLDLVGVFVTTLPSILTKLLKLGIALYYCLSMSWAFLLIAMLEKPLTLALNYYAGMLMQKRNMQTNELESRLADALTDVFGGAHRLIAANGQLASHARICDHSKRAEKYALKTVWLGAYLETAGTIVSLLSEMFFLYYGVTRILKCRLSIGLLLAFQTYVGMITGSIMSLSGTYSSLISMLGDVARVVGVVLDDGDDEHVARTQLIAFAPPRPIKGRTSVFEDNALTSALGKRAAEKNRYDRAYMHLGVPFSKLANVRGEVHFDDVHFAYPTGVPRAPSSGPDVLKGMTFHLSAGEHATICGSSGAGKSTVLSLCLRFYDVLPGSGRVLLDKHSVATINPYALREAIALVPQEPLLFSATIRENLLQSASCRDLLLANQEALGVGESMTRPMRGRLTAAEANALVSDALRAVNLDEYINGLPKGVDTPIGRGSSVTLSSGQMQRVNVASMLLRQPVVVLLDEITSALDRANERAINETIRRRLSDATVVHVSHRLQHVVDADRILFCRDGAVAEDGTHGELKAKPDGLYAALISTVDGDGPTAEANSDGPAAEATN